MPEELVRMREAPAQSPENKGSSCSSRKNNLHVLAKCCAASESFKDSVEVFLQCSAEIMT